MPDDVTRGQEPSDGGQEPQNDQSPAGGGDGQTPEHEKFDAEYVKKLRAEAADYRRRLRELESTVKQHEDAKLSDMEKLQKRSAQLERQLAEYERERQERTVRYEVMLAAGKLGIIDPEAAYRLLDLAALEYDEEGTPSNLEAALKSLVKSKPYLVAQPAGGGSPTNPSRGGNAVLTREDIEKMSPEEINRRWDEISRVLSLGR